MKKDSVIAAIISVCSIALGIFIFLDVLPFLFVWASLVATNNEDIIALQEKSINSSVFKFQKIYTRNSALPSLYLMKKYDKVIVYFKDLEKMNAVESMDTTLAIMSYINVQDYDSALKYAKESDNKSLLAKIYIKTGNFVAAKPLVEELLAKNKRSLPALIYKSEMLLAENKLKDAENYVDKALKINPNYIEALNVKANILNKYGKKDGAKKYASRAKALELKRSSLYK